VRGLGIAAADNSLRVRAAAREKGYFENPNYPLYK